jgi:hypothetical protein
MLVAVDKFTKWIEATPVTTQDSTTAINFIKSIVFRFRVPHDIITDNGTNLTSKEFKIIVKVWASSLILPPWHTRRQTDRLKKPTG